MINLGSKNIIGMNESIVLIGGTGCGKSTTINLLLKLQLFSVKKSRNQYTINLKEKEQGALIGDTSISVTSIPQRYQCK